jgi:molybdopterin converting factor small subunit
MDEQVIDFSSAAAPAPTAAGTPDAPATWSEAPALDAAPRLLARLREALLASEPGIEPGLVAGDTLEELEASFAAARELLQRMRDAVRQESAAAVPAGAPGRHVASPASPFEKIRAGLGRLS